MAFELSLSKAVDMESRIDEAGHTELSIQFKYVRFVMKLDDKIKKDKLVELITGSVKKKKKPDEPVKMPKLYKE